MDGLKGIPESVTRFAGKRVEIVGYLFPTGHVDGPEAEMWGAVNESGPAPDINQTVHVTVPEGALRRSLNKRVRVTGIFTVGATVIDGYCVSIYNLLADDVKMVQ